jgi:hypothetical protein
MAPKKDAPCSAEKMPLPEAKLRLEKAIFRGEELLDTSPFIEVQYRTPVPRKLSSGYILIPGTSTRFLVSPTIRTSTKRSFAEKSMCLRAFFGKLRMT